MKKIITTLLLVLLAISPGISQNKKAEREAAAQAMFEKAKAAINAKEFVIVPDSYEKSDGSPETNTDDAIFISYETDFFYLQGEIVCGNKFTNRAEVTSYNVKEDKKGNLFVEMQVKGNQITARVEIQMRKGSNYADITVYPTKGDARKFSGEVVPRAEAKYFKRPNVV